MTPQQFEAEYAGVVEYLVEQTHLDPNLFYAQFALESSWGTSQVAQHFNLAGIKYAGGYYGSTPFGAFAAYPSLGQFEQDYLRVLSLPFYENVLASAGLSLGEQITALGESIWSETHYGDPPGSSLYAFLNQLSGVEDLTPEQGDQLSEVQGILQGTTPSRWLVMLTWFEANKANFEKLFNTPPEVEPAEPPEPAPVLQVEPVEAPSSPVGQDVLPTPPTPTP